MKANSAPHILRYMAERGVGIDAVTLNEVAHAARHGYRDGKRLGNVMFAADEFANNRNPDQLPDELQLARAGAAISVGSPFMVRQLFDNAPAHARKVPLSFRINPGVGHGQND